MLEIIGKVYNVVFLVIGICLKTFCVRFLFIATRVKLLNIISNFFYQSSYFGLWCFWSVGWQGLRLCWDILYHVSVQKKVVVFLVSGMLRPSTVFDRVPSSLEVVNPYTLHIF